MEFLNGTRMSFCMACVCYTGTMVLLVDLFVCLLVASCLSVLTDGTTPYETDIVMC